MKKIFIVLGIVVLAFVFFAMIKNQIIKSVVTMVSSKIIGAPVTIDGLSLSFLNSTIKISGLKIYNPDGFPKGTLVECSTVNVVYDRSTLLKEQRHFLLVEIDLQEMTLAKNKSGKLNVDSLKIVQQPKSSSSLPMQIDLLTLSIGKIIYKDYTAGAEPSVRVYDVNKQKSYKKIPTAQQLALLVLAEPMKAAAIKNAEIYGVAMLSGAAMLPVAVAATLISKDNVQQSVDASLEQVYKVSLDVMRQMGTITKEDAPGGVIKANVKGSMVAMMLRKGTDNKTEITISARKYMLPKLDIASGVLYEIIDKL